MSYNNQPFKTDHFWEFCGSPVKILWFHCHGPGSIHGHGTKFPQAVWHSQKTKEEKKPQTKLKPKLTTFKRLLRLRLSHERYIGCGHCPQSALQNFYLKTGLLKKNCLRKESKKVFRNVEFV